jgi:MFS family permease
MDHKKTNRLTALFVFIVTILTYLYTLPPTVVFWDVPEHSAASSLLQVQHPPGSPLLVLVMHIASMIPIFTDIAVRMIFLNALASAMVVTLLYLITVRLILMRHAIPSTTFDKFAVYGSSAIGALALTFSTTFWFNATELETRNTSLLFTALIIWLVLRWHENYEKPKSDMYLLLITFLVGLTTGIHIHGLLGFMIAILIVYFRFYKHSLQHFIFSADIIKFGVVASLIFFGVYPGIVKWYPSMLDGDVFGITSVLWIVIAIALPIAALYLVFYSTQRKNRILNIASLSFLFILLGYSVYTVVYVRANANTPMNENNPNTIKRLVVYLEREQYGETPLMARRWSNEPDKVEYFKNYTSDADYFWRYQINHMYLRYFGWNFIGKVDDFQGAGVKFSQLFALPLLLGLFGFYYHWKTDPKMAFIMTIYFVLTGLALAVYFNMQQEQPRERDYFFVYSFFGFCLWIGMGTLAIIKFIRRTLDETQGRIAGYAVLTAALLFVPVNMLRTNVHPSSRYGHYVAWDYAYNLLQSTEKDAVLITNGDNDTFTLWYLQDVEGIRRDVRVICLSLANTDWYIMQLKHEEPFGAKKVPISMTDEQITGIQPIQYEPQTFNLPVTRNAAEGWDPSNTDPRGLQVVDTLKFTMPATLHFGNVNALRVQDILVFDIIRTANWQRPIYFAQTGGDDSKIGLQNHMEMRGLAMKLVPRTMQSFWDGINESVLKQQLLTDIKEPSQGPQWGFRWRGLRDPKVHFDENQRRLIMNYRQVFLSFAAYLQNVKHDSTGTIAALNRMEYVVPRSLLPLDYRAKSEITQMYLTSHDTVTAREYAAELVTELSPSMTGPITEPLDQYHPLIVIAQAYEILGNYEKAIAAMQRLGELYSTTPGVTNYVQQRVAMLNGRK